MKKGILSVILLAITSMAFSQTPGYLGKRMMFGYETAISINLDIKLRRTNEVYLEYVLNRSISLSALYKWYNVDLVFDEYANFIEQVDPYDNEGFTESSYNVEFNGDLDVSLYGLGFTHYYSNIAPLGNYYKFELLYAPFKANPGSVAIDDYSDDVIFDENDLNYIGYHTFVLNFEIGKTKIFFNRVTTKLAIKTGFSFDYLPIILEGRENLNSSNVVFNSSIRRINTSLLIGMKLGIGLLAF